MGSSHRSAPQRTGVGSESTPQSCSALYAIIHRDQHHLDASEMPNTANPNCKWKKRKYAFRRTTTTGESQRQQRWYISATYNVHLATERHQQHEHDPSPISPHLPAMQIPFSHPAQPAIASWALTTLLGLNDTAESSRRLLSRTLSLSLHISLSLHTEIHQQDWTIEAVTQSLKH